MKQFQEVPNGWENIKLKRLITLDIKNGYSPNCPDEPNGSWILSLGNLTENGFDPLQAKPAPIDDIRVKDFLLESGDFLISRSNTLDKVGRVILFRGEIKNCSYPDLLMKFRIDEAYVINEYLEVFLRSSMVRKYIQGCASGTSNSMVKINKTVVEKIPVIIPPYFEQKAIADLLSTWDEAIEKTERLVQLKKKQFIRFLNDLIYIPTVNEKWKEVRTKSLFKERRETNRDDLPLLSITNNEGVIPRDETNRRDTSNEDKSKYLRICSGDIGYNTMRMWQGVSALATLEGIVSPAYTICIPGEKLYPQFVAFLFKTPFMIHRFYRYSQGLTSDTWNLKYPNFCEVKMPLPSLEEQRQIAEVLTIAQQEINLLKQLVDKYKTQKRGLMQKMLTGVWRVKPEIVKNYEL
jgi:type I restriction enzyme S subunit